MDSYKDDLTLYHHGIKGQRWGVRRYQNADGSLTSAGKKRYSFENVNLLSEAVGEKRASGDYAGAKAANKEYKKVLKERDQLDREWARAQVKQVLDEHAYDRTDVPYIRKAKNALAAIGIGTVAAGAAQKAAAATTAKVLSKEALKVMVSSSAVSKAASGAVKGITGNVGAIGLISKKMASPVSTMMGYRATAAKLASSKLALTSIGTKLAVAAPIAAVGGMAVYGYVNRKMTGNDTALLNKHLSGMKAPSGRTIRFVESNLLSPTFGGAHSRIRFDDPDKKKG